MMKKELEKMIKSAGTQKFDAAFEKAKKYRDNPEAKSIVSNLLKKELKNSIQEMKLIKKEIELKQQMHEISEILSLSYISKTYFNRTAQWLYQKINGNTVNGKTSKFTENELKNLQLALKDISKKIGALSVVG